MGIQTLESMIRAHAQEALNNRRIRNKDILAWCSCAGSHDVPTSYGAGEGEVGVYLDDIGIFAVFPSSLDKRQ